MTTQFASESVDPPPITDDDRRLAERLRKTLRRGRGPISDTIRWLSIFTGALSLFYLGQTWIEFGLSEVFLRVHEWYAGIFYPLVNVLTPAARWIAEYFQVSLPIWWRDAVVLYLAVGGGLARARRPFNYWVGPGRDFVDVMERANRTWTLTAPVRMVAWPLYLLVDVFRTLTNYNRGDHLNYWEHFYFPLTILGFARIVAGAFAFTVLNAFV